jgi:hypothetical protein
MKAAQRRRAIVGARQIGIKAYRNDKEWLDGSVSLVLA